MVLLSAQGMPVAKIAEVTFTADHASHKEQGSMIRRYIIWRNRHADDTRLRQVVARASVA